MAGTEASHRVAEWLRDQYRSFGFDAEIVTYSAWLPQPREVKLELIEPAASLSHRPNNLSMATRIPTTSAQSPHLIFTHLRGK